MWKHIKNTKKDNIGIPSLVHNNSVVADDLSKAEIFNAYFHSVFVSDQADLNLVTQNFTHLSEMEDVMITETGVMTLLSNLNSHSAHGPDGISNHILKLCAIEIAPFLVAIFNKSLDYKKLPNDWKLANVTPIHKDGDRANICNYRPVSLTSVSCKTLEHIIYSGLMKHLNGHDFFTTAQHGFRSGLSCTTQLTEFIHDVAEGIDRGVQIDAVFLDFRKAFDVVSHSLLLTKLSYLGIPSRLLGWIQDYLYARRQRVLINGVTSQSVQVLSGVPQGSVLGPLLFLVFVNDLPSELCSRVRLYADDCVLYRSVTCANDTILLQSDLDKVCACVTNGR